MFILFIIHKNSFDISFFISNFSFLSKRVHFEREQIFVVGCSTRVFCNRDGVLVFPFSKKKHFSFWKHHFELIDGCFWSDCEFVYASFDLFLLRFFIPSIFFCWGAQYMGVVCCCGLAFRFYMVFLPPVWAPNQLVLGCAHHSPPKWGLQLFCGFEFDAFPSADSRVVLVFDARVGLFARNCIGYPFVHRFVPILVAHDFDSKIGTYWKVICHTLSPQSSPRKQSRIPRQKLWRDSDCLGSNFWHLSRGKSPSGFWNYQRHQLKRFLDLCFSLLSKFDLSG